MPGQSGRLFLRTLRVSVLVLLVLAAGCRPAREDNASADFSDRTIDAVATTNIVGDLVRAVGGEHVNLTVLMGPGVDPHLFRASEGDVQTLVDADVIFYNGLHLEGNMTEIFEQMKRRGMRTVPVAEAAIAEARLIESEAYAGNYDPHVWFDVELWMEAAQYVAEVLAEMDPAHAEVYAENVRAYLEEMEALDAYAHEQARRVPEEQRVLITSHDAFSYFGRAYDFEVRGLQGISTASEAGTADVQRLAAFVAERRIPALFVESSVPPGGLRAVQQAVRARGFDVEVGGTLYGDALGDHGTPEGTYVGALRHNIDTIVGALLREET